jgi:hypothetical protein
MRNALISLSVGVLLILIIGCNSQPKPATVEFLFMNKTQHDLDRATLDSGVQQISVGFLAADGDKSIFGQSWSMGDKANVTFIDEKTEQPYSIDVSLTEVNELVKAGKCRAVTVSILDYNKAEITTK